MPFCAKCGQQYNDGVRFCPSCGASADQPEQGSAPQQEYQANTYQQPPQQNYQQAPNQQAGAVFTGNKTMAILAVIFQFLFFLPLVTGDKTEFDKFWANQALLLFLLSILASITAFIIIGFLIGLVGFVFWIMALISVCNGQMKPLPIIGGIKIIS